DYAERILALSGELESTLKRIGGQEVGPLLIGASTTLAEFLLPKILGEFKARHPGVMPQLVVANSEAVQARVAERSLDLGFIEGDSHLPTLANEVCCDDELVVVCAPSHALARRDKVPVKALTEHAYVSRESGSGTREVINHYLQKAGLSLDAVQVVMEAGSPEALKGIVATGLGFAIMSGAVAEKEVRLGELVRIPLSPRLVRHLCVVYPKERFHSKVFNAFIAFAREGLAQTRGSDAMSASA